MRQTWAWMQEQVVDEDFENAAEHPRPDDSHDAEALARAAFDAEDTRWRRAADALSADERAAIISEVPRALLERLGYPSARYFAIDPVPQQL